MSRKCGCTLSGLSGTSPDMSAGPSRSCSAESNASISAHSSFAIALDMAKLEWAEIEAFDSAEHDRLGPADISGLVPDSPLRVQPHLRLIEVGYEVEPLLQ